MEQNLTTIYLTIPEIRQWTMMQFLNSVGAFDIKGGRLTIDFDHEGRIGNVKIEKNYKPEP